MRVLITGACGFVGRHFSKRLTNLGHIVTGVDNLMSESSLSPGKWPEHLRCDIDFVQEDCRLFFKRPELDHFDLVLHLAAVVGGRAVIENSPISVADDLCIDAEFFQWCVTSKPTKIIYFSSSAAYPINLQKESGHSLIEKDLDLNDLKGIPDLSYGFSKLTGEYLAKIAHETYNLDIVCYRPFSGYGEDQHAAYPFIGILNRILNKENPIDIWSNCVRDFVYIEDAVDAVLETMNKIHDGSSINICSGIATSFTELVSEMSRVCEHEGTVNILNDMPQGVYWRVGDPTYVNSLGWYAKTSLIDGIKISKKYLQNH